MSTFPICPCRSVLRCYFSFAFLASVLLIVSQGKASDQEPDLVLKGHELGVAYLAASRDGKLLVTGDNGATVKFWDPIRGKESKNIKAHTKTLDSMKLSDDG